MVEIEWRDFRCLRRKYLLYFCVLLLAVAYFALFSFLLDRVEIVIGYRGMQSGTEVYYNIFTLKYLQYFKKCV